ncbi:hypothetical protein FA95DRAFT_1561172 [Auriscalpium vulgare]|uniref:Uncharacterized protein n=1 Tax=Auriscalpium vulgare TaxID=40419 RepID=A0ACB8RMP5_9AGAM|nr:hypothetical protein FA95DRAFT_1561172 [Auriscalpium vulgare]
MASWKYTGGLYDIADHHGPATGVVAILSSCFRLVTGRLSSAQDRQRRLSCFLHCFRILKNEHSRYSRGSITCTGVYAGAVTPV